MLGELNDTPEVVVEKGIRFVEGPNYHQGRVYFTELSSGSIWSIDAAARNGTADLFAKPMGTPNGTAWGPDGQLYVVNSGPKVIDPNGRSRELAPDYEGGWLDVFDKDGNQQHRYTECDGERLSAPNDIVFDAEGNFYFTDSMNARPQPLTGLPITWERDLGFVYMGNVDGRPLKKVVTHLRLANGLAISDDGGTLIVAETLPGTLSKFDIEAPGKVAVEKKPFIKLPGDSQPDGFALASDGSVVVAGLAPGGGGLIVFEPSGELRNIVAREEEFVTNVAFGGEDDDRVFFTESISGRVMTMPWPVKGMRLFPER